MYVRPQLFRKQTGDRFLLLKEHESDVKANNQVLEIGKEYEEFSEKLSEISKQIADAEKLSREDIEPILKKILQQLFDLQKQYDFEINAKTHDIECSMQERIEEMKTITEKGEQYAVYMEKFSLETDCVDIDKLRFEVSRLLRKYQNTVELAKKDLQRQMEKSETQREIIKNNILRTRGV